MSRLTRPVARDDIMIRASHHDILDALFECVEQITRTEEFFVGIFRRPRGVVAGFFVLKSSERPPQIMASWHGDVRNSQVASSDEDSLTCSSRDQGKPGQ